MLVRHIMTVRPITVAMDDTLQRAKDLFDEHGFHHLLVLHHRRLVGVVSDRDLLRHLSPFVGKLAERTQDLATLNRKVHQIMTRRLITVQAETPLTEAARHMLDHGVSSLPVVDEQMRPLGIVTSRDLLRVLAPEAEAGLGV